MQRVLAAHEQIHSATSEPHILLPYLYTVRTYGVYAEYDHNNAVRSIEDFYANMPGGKEEYLREVREFALRVYAKTTPQSARYFLDKTPRYHLIANDVMQLFPEGKFLFLWRNPLAVLSSNMETWANGKWNLYRYKVDLFDGIEKLVEAYSEHGAEAHAMRFEDLIANPVEEWAKVFDYLELPFDPSVLEKFADIGLLGRMGDTSGTELYDHVSREPMSKWRRSLSNPVRKTWSSRYLRWIGADRLATMGYGLEELLAELDSVPTSSQGVGSDLVRMGYGVLFQLFEPRMLKHKAEFLPSWRRIHTHR